jgi:peptide/nickel transport system ATP-binding protein
VSHTPESPDLLTVGDLRVVFGPPGAPRLTALDGIELRLARGEILGLVGETGCGKTMTGLSVLRLLPPGASVARGSITFEGQELLGQSERAVRRLRGRRIAMIFQNPAAAFNPVFTIGWQIERVMVEHQRLSRAERRDRLHEVLGEVGLPDVRRVARAYPHQLSGGMLQRAMIAMALVNRPSLIIADEPTTALDATIAAQVLGLLRRLQQEYGFGVMFITHNLDAVRRVCDRVAVLYAGRVVETAPTDELFTDPQHPYTQGLLRSVPSAAARGRRLVAIEGTVPTDPGAVIGCSFAPRCPLAFDACHAARPRVVDVNPSHMSACLLAGTGAIGLVAGRRESTA